MHECMHFHTVGWYIGSNRTPGIIITIKSQSKRIAAPNTAPMATCHDDGRRSPAAAPVSGSADGVVVAETAVAALEAVSPASPWPVVELRLAADTDDELSAVVVAETLAARKSPKPEQRLTYPGSNAKKEQNK